VEATLRDAYVSRDMVSGVLSLDDLSFRLWKEVIRDVTTGLLGALYIRLFSASNIS
jgi:hypothetical protein